MSHSLALSALTDQQRVHLALAEDEFARLTQLLAPARATSLSGHQWQIASCLATTVADQSQRIADLAPAATGTWWTTMARRLRDAAARFEVAADLADLAAELIADAAGPDAAHANTAADTRR